MDVDKLLFVRMFVLVGMQRKVSVFNSKGLLFCDLYIILYLLLTPKILALDNEKKN